MITFSGMIMKCNILFSLKYPKVKNVKFHNTLLKYIIYEVYIRVYNMRKTYHDNTNNVNHINYIYICMKECIKLIV